MAGRLVKKQGKGKGKGKSRKKGQRAKKTPADGAANAASGGSSSGGDARGDEDSRGRVDVEAGVAGAARRPRGDAASGKSGTTSGPSAATGAGRSVEVSAGRHASAAAGGDDVAAPLARWFLWADSPLAVRRVILGLGALCAVLFLFDIVWHRHAYVPGEGLWGFHAIAGFVSFTVIVLGAKSLRTLIRRDEDYYGAAAIDGEAYPDGGLATLGVRDGEDAGHLLAVRDARVVGRANVPDSGSGDGPGDDSGGRRVGGGRS